MSDFFGQKILNDLGSVFAKVKYKSRTSSLQSGTVYVVNPAYSRIGKVVQVQFTLQVVADYHHHLSNIGALFNTVKDAINRGDLKDYTITSKEFEQMSRSEVLRVLNLSYQCSLVGEDEESPFIKQIKTTNHLDITL